MHPPRTRARGIAFAIAALAVAGFLALNVVAYRQAWCMLHFADGEGSLTEGPHKLGVFEKARVVVTGIHMPHPKNVRTPATLGMPYATERFATRDGIDVESWWIPRDDARLLVDQRGCGGTSGNDTTIGFREMAEVEAAVAHVHGAHGAPGPVVLYGQSMGGVSMLHALATKRTHADGVILEAVFDRMLNTVRNRFDAMGLPSFPSAELLCFWGGRQFGFDAFRHNPSDYARAITTPTLVLQGAHDDFARLDEGRRIYENLAGPKCLVVFSNTEHEALRHVDPALWRREVAGLLASAANATTATRVTRPSPPDARPPSPDARLPRS